jgi:hypothetical protein
MSNYTDKYLTQEPPRSPRVRLGGFVILARSIDKCRALLSKKIGEYDFDCELDRRLFDWKGITGNDLKKYIAEGHNDDEIVEWVKKNGVAQSDTEIMRWSDAMDVFAYEGDDEGIEWLQKQFKRLGLPKDATLFDYLDADDNASFRKLSNPELISQ